MWPVGHRLSFYPSIHAWRYSVRWRYFKIQRLYKRAQFGCMRCLFTTSLRASVSSRCLNASVPFLTDKVRTPGSPYCRSPQILVHSESRDPSSHSAGVTGKTLTPQTHRLSDQGSITFFPSSALRAGPALGPSRVAFPTEVRIFWATFGDFHPSYILYLKGILS